MLLGVTLFAARTVQFDRIDPEHSRELFIRHALVERDWTTRHRFFAQNQQALDDVAAWEERTRRRDIVVDDETLFALYDARIPADVTSARHFDSWWKKAARETPDLMTFTTEMLIAAGSERFDAAAFPDRFTSGGVDLELGYVFDPGRRDDGVTVTIPLAVLARVDPAAFDRQIPGLRSDLAVALIRSLPKTLRRNFVPAPDFAKAALARIPEPAPGAGPAAGSIPAQLAAALTALTGIIVKPTDFDMDKVPDHLRMNFTVVDDKGRAVGTGRDLGTLQSALQADTRQAVAKASGTVEKTGLTAFPADGVRRSVTSTVAGHQVTGYPALVDEGTTVGLQVFTSAADQTQGDARRHPAAARAGHRLPAGAPAAVVVPGTAADDGRHALRLGRGAGRGRHRGRHRRVAGLGRRSGVDCGVLRRARGEDQTAPEQGGPGRRRRGRAGAAGGRWCRPGHRARRVRGPRGSVDRRSGGRHARPTQRPCSHPDSSPGPGQPRCPT